MGLRVGGKGLELELGERDIGLGEWGIGDGVLNRGIEAGVV